MRTPRAFLVLVLVAVLGACGASGGSSSDTVSQPEGEIDNGGDGFPLVVDDQITLDSRADCKKGSLVESRPLRVVTTVAPITSLVASIVGNAKGVQIEGLVPEGTNSHTFEPPPSAARTLEQADIVFTNGLYLEEPTTELAAANAKKAIVCELGTATLEPQFWQYDFSFPREAGKPNPHIWTNPTMVLPMLTLIRDALVAADPANGDTYDANYVKLTVLVNGLDAAMDAATETVPVRNRKLLTYHDAYAYFAERYGYEVIGAVQPQSFEEPSPQEVADLIEQVKRSGVPAVFGSEVFPSPVLEQIGKETGVRYVDVLRDDDLLGKPGDPEHSWWGLMRFNFVTMVEALGGDASGLKALANDGSLVDRASYPQ